MVKEFEEEFKDRFTEHDKEYMKYLESKTKPLIIVYPFDEHRGGGRGGYQGGGFRYNNRGRNHHYHPYNRNQDNHRNFNQQHRYQNYQQRPYNHDNKRFRRDE